jgi:hypothetical protein
MINSNLEDLGEKFDIVYMEGSIYIMGFYNGLNKWKNILNKNGYFLCSELSWIVRNFSNHYIYLR